jgi:chaperonin GroES
MNPTQIRPIRDFILLQPEDHPEATKGGIIIPRTVKDKTQFGTVLRVGPGRVLESGRRVESELRAGDKVVYLENTIAQRISPSSKDGDPVLLPEMDIIAVVES